MIAEAVTRAIYVEHDETETFFGMAEADFTHQIYSRGLLWAPDGDEAFDDSSYVLQFDVDDRVRIIAFQRPEDSLDLTSIRDVSMSGDEFYAILQQWHGEFVAEWNRLIDKGAHDD